MCRDLALQSARKGCRMLFLPECCAFIGVNQQEVGGAMTSRLVNPDCGRCSSVLHGACALAGACIATLHVHTPALHVTLMDSDVHPPAMHLEA